MINLAHEVTPGKPRGGKQQVEYAWVKMEIVELLHAEVPDKEIAARLNLSASGFYQLKRRILRESIDLTMAQNVAAREYMRLSHQETQLIKYMNQCWDSDDGPPDAPYITAFTNLSKRIADLLGANAAVAVTVEEIDGNRSAQIRRDQHDQARNLKAFYELSRRVASSGVGSGLSDEELERELTNITAALGEGGNGGEGDGADDATAITDAELIDDDADDADADADYDPTTSSTPDADVDLTHLVEIDGFSPDEWSVHGGETITVGSLNRGETKALIREIAGGHGDQETPGRWVAGKFISWWHDSGDATPDDFDYDMQPLGDELDGAV